MSKVLVVSVEGMKHVFNSATMAHAYLMKKHGVYCSLEELKESSEDQIFYSSKDAIDYAYKKNDSIALVLKQYFEGDNCD